MKLVVKSFCPRGTPFLFPSFFFLFCFVLLVMMRSLVVVFALVAVASAGLPSHFDCRDYWTWCSFTILDQHHCGSCWAFASMEAFGDRLCAFNDSSEKGLIMSPQPLLECSSDKGCNGGSPHVAWDWVEDNYNSNCIDRCTDGCLEYVSGYGDVPKCHESSHSPWGTCNNGSSYYLWHKAFGFDYLPNDEYKIRDAIYWNGPVQACFHLYDDFYTFFDDHPDGIYTKHTGDRDGSHCVKLIGWGTESGTDYWVIANSWGTDFAEKGFFKFKRGINLCNLEDEASQGYVYNQLHNSAVNVKREANPRVKLNPLGGGHWVVQDLSVATTDYGMYAKRALEVIEGKEDGVSLVLKEVVEVQTQVVNGLNINMQVVVENGMNVSLRLHRDLKMKIQVIDYSVLRV